MDVAQITIRARVDVANLVTIMSLVLSDDGLAPDG